MLDVTIVNESSPEANRNRRAGGPMCREAASPKISILFLFGGILTKILSKYYKEVKLKVNMFV